MGLGLGGIRKMYSGVNRVPTEYCTGNLNMYNNVHNMSTANLNKAFRALAKQGGWAVSEATLRLALGQSVNTFRVLMSRYTKAGEVQRLGQGIYRNPYLQPPSWALERLAARLRPDDSFYVSLESALHEYGRISQIPTRLTLMTTGTSRTFETPLGVIEFTHSKRDIHAMRDRMTFLPDRSIHFASEELALEDLHHTGRNTGLVLPAEEE